MSDPDPVQMLKDLYGPKPKVRKWGPLKDLVSRVNNLQHDVRQAHARLGAKERELMKAMKVLAGHPHCPKEAGKKVTVLLPMAASAHGKWSFIVEVGGQITRIRNVDAYMDLELEK